MTMEPTHPRTGAPLTELERTLWRFRMVAHEAQVMHRGFNRAGDISKTINEDLMFGITHQAMIIVSKFLEVWDDFGSLARHEPLVVPTRRALDSIIERINIWPGLATYRNVVLAHAYLDRDGALLPPWELLRAGRAPSYHAEIVLLLFLVHYAVLGVLSVFEAIYTGIDPLAGPPAATGPRADIGLALGKDIPDELRRVIGPVDEGLKQQCDVVVGGPLADAFKRAITA